MDAIIVGAAETRVLGRNPGQSVLELNVEGGLRALADAGLEPGQIDGVAGAYSPHGVAHALGITPRWVDTTNVGGCSFLMHVRHAAAAIAAGHAARVLITHGESGRSRTGTVPRPRDPRSWTGQFEEPYGARPPYTRFTLPALRHLHDRGLDETALAQVVVAQRRWSSRVPRAGRRDPMTVGDVLAAPVLAWPFTVPMVCMLTDGGGGLVVTAPRHATAGQLRRSVRVLGTGEGSDPLLVAQAPDPSGDSAARRAADDAFAEARVGRSEIDHVMVYDAFAHLPLIGLECLGLAPAGGAAELITAGETSPGGSLPLNTNGGGLAYTHTGMYGMFAVQEAVRQLRREAAAQVPGVGTSAVLGYGGMFTAASVLILVQN
ncbi:thiolase [Actinomadura sp. CNU-125]|uniref:thiolase C-terminal domain-containing protein n=1 Tax=Actinomadura sp. CNU-125 TaxID=1904961 RepID=UPI00095DAA62|nr:thiolase [Actinomadura sp. CNU-125]OLT11033.1 thiolase [Actinomadura sp. CNU-125]